MKTLKEMMEQTVKDSNGNPLMYEGEEVTTQGMLDLALIQLAKDDINAQIYLRELLK